MKTRLGFVLIFALNISSLTFAEEKTETIELNILADVFECTLEPNGSIKECISSNGNPENLPKDISIPLQCGAKSKNCSGDWDLTVTKNGQNFYLNVNVTKEANSEGRFEYTITAGSTTINLGNGNQLTDSFGSIGQIVFADQKAYLPVIGISPKGKRPSLKMFHF